MPINQKTIASIFEPNSEVKLNFDDTYNTEASAKEDTRDILNKIMRERVQQALSYPVSGGIKIISDDKYRDAVSAGVNPFARDINNLDESIQNAKENKDRERAINQPWYEQLRNMLDQMVINEVAVGTVKAFSDIFNSAIEVFQPEDERNYTNPVSEWLEEQQNKFRDTHPIYRENPTKAWDIADTGWWFDNGVSVMSTVSLLLPGLGVSGIARGIGRGVTKLGKVGKIANIADWGGKLEASIAKGLGATGKITNAGLNTVRINRKADVALTALGSRIAENAQEARQVYETVNQNILNELNNLVGEDREKFFENNPKFVGMTNQQIADKISVEEADNAFNNDMLLILSDIVQLRAINNLWKNLPVRRTTAKLASAQEDELNNLAKKAGKEITNKNLSFWDKVKLGAKYEKQVVLSEFTEALEEGWQGIQQAQGEETANNYFKKINDFTTLGDYLFDPEILEQAAWGWLGGVVFQGFGEGFGKAKNKVKETYWKKIKHLSDAEIEKRQASDNKHRLAEIENRSKLFDQLVNDLNTINQGRLPKSSAEYNPNDENENILKDEAEKNFHKEQYIKNFISNLTMDAIDNGNLELLKSFINDERFRDYFRKQGIEQDLSLESLTNSAIDEAANAYQDSLAQVYSNINEANPIIAKYTARAIATAKLVSSAYDKRIEADNTQLNLSSEQNWDNNFDDYQMYAMTSGIIRKYVDSAKKFKESNAKRLSDLQAGTTEFGKTARQGTAAYSKEAAKVYYRQMQRNIQVLVDLLNDYNLIGDKLSNVKQTLDGYFKSIADNFSEDNLDNENNLEQIDALLSPLKGEYTNFGWSKDYEALKAKLTADTIRRQMADNSIPKDNKQIQDYYDDTEVVQLAMMSSRIQNAAKIIRDRLRTAEDPRKEFTKLIDGTYTPDKELTEALNFLRLGTENRVYANNLIYSAVEQFEQEQNKNKEEEKEVNVDGEPINEEAAVKHNEEIEKKKVEKPISTESQANSVLETEGNVVQTPDEEEDTGGNVVPEFQEEAEPQPSPEEEERIKAESKTLSHAPIFHTETLHRIVKETFDELAKSETEKGDIISALRKINDSGAVNKASEFNDLVETVFDKLSKGEYATDYTPSELRNAIREYLSNIINNYRAFHNKAFTLTATEKNFIDGIQALINSIRIDDEQNSRITSITKNEALRALGIIISNYWDAAGKKAMISSDGRKVVDVYELFSYVVDLFKRNQISSDVLYNTIEQLSVNIVDVLYTANLGEDRETALILGKQFVFVGTELLNDFIKRNGQETSTLVTNILAELNADNLVKDIAVKDDSMHAAMSTYIRNLSPRDKAKIFYAARTHKLQVGFHELANGSSNISIYYIDSKNPNADEQGRVEVGYLDTVKVSSDNTTFSLVNASENSINYGVKLIGNDNYQLLSKGVILDTINSLISAAGNNNSEEVNKIYDILLKRINASHFRGKTNATAFALTLQDYDYFLNSNIIRDYVEDANLKLRDGKELIDITRNYDELIKTKTNEVFNIIANSISNVLFFDYYNTYTNKETDEFKKSIINPTEEQLRASLNNYAKSIFNNYKRTYQLQSALNAGKAIEVQFNKSGSEAANINQGSKTNVSTLTFADGIKNHPLIIFNENGGISEDGSILQNAAQFRDGTMGILLDNSTGAPIVALLNGTNLVFDSTDKKLSNAIKKYITDAINEYYNSPLNEASYTKFRDTLSDLFSGNKTIFKGFRIVDGAGKNSFQLRWYNPNAKDENKWEAFATFYKYDALYRDGKWYEIADNGDGTYEYGKAVTSTYPPIGKFTVLDYREKGKRSNRTINTDIAKELADNLFSKVVFSPIAFEFGKVKNDNKFIKYNNDGSFNVEIKHNNEILYNEKFKNYTDYIKKTNAFTTSHAGKSIAQKYIERGIGANGTLHDSKSIFINFEIPGEGRSFIDAINNLVGDKGSIEINTKQLLELAGIDKDIINQIRSLNTKLRSSVKIIPNRITIDTTRDTTDSASYYNGQITIFNEGIKTISLSKEDAIRLLMHEQMHRNFEKSNFFTDSRYGAIRASQAAKTFEQFVQYVLADENAKESLKAFMKEFYTEYGKDLFDITYKPGTTEIANIKLKSKFDVVSFSELSPNESKYIVTFANEWLTETITQDYLMDYLNTIEYKGDRIESKKSLLQTIFDIIRSIFDYIAKTKARNDDRYSRSIIDNSILNEIRNILGNNPTLVVTPNKETKTESAVKEATSEETPIEKLSLAEEDKDFLRSLNGEDEEQDNFSEEESEDNEDELGELDSKFESISDAIKREQFDDKNEVAIDNVNKDTSFNPFGVAVVDNMTDYINKFRPQDRPKIEANLRLGAIKWVCR